MSAKWPTLIVQHVYMRMLVETACLFSLSIISWHCNHRWCIRLVNLHICWKHSKQLLQYLFSVWCYWIDYSYMFVFWVLHVTNPSPVLYVLFHLMVGQSMTIFSKTSLYSKSSKVRKATKIWNWYNQVPHLTLDTTWESDKNTIKLSQTRAKRSNIVFPQLVWPQIIAEWAYVRNSIENLFESSLFEIDLCILYYI